MTLSISVILDTDDKDDLQILLFLASLFQVRDVCSSVLDIELNNLHEFFWPRDTIGTTNHPKEGSGRAGLEEQPDLEEARTHPDGPHWKEVMNQKYNSLVDENVDESIFIPYETGHHRKMNL